MRRNRKGKARKWRARTQREILRDVMLSANECGAWLTLAELSAMTRYQAASISAQLRHLKKPRFGAYVLEKQRRTVDEVVCPVEHGVVWEYRLSRRQRVTRAAGLAAAMAVC